MREIVEAGAGCGKTYGLVTRYLAALGVYRDEVHGRAARRTTPGKILTLTFTNDAASEMRTRIVRALLDARQPELARSVEEQGRISTFHSFCYKVIKPHLPKLGYPDGDVLSVIESQAHKMSHVLATLAVSPLSEDVQRLVDLKRLYQFCVANWRRPRRELESEIDEVYRAVAEHSERWIREGVALGQKHAALDPTMFENPEVWPYQTLEALETRDWAKLAEIKFNGKGHKPAWAKEYPELRAHAGLARDFAQKDLHEYLNVDTRGREKLAYSVLFDFLEEVQRSAPPLLDFDALEAETQKFLSAHPEEAPKYDLIIVDEFQDTNRRQVEILDGLMHESTELYFVGDPKQAIYSFRGGDVRVFESQKQKLQLSSLDVNRRSYPHALTFMNELTRGIFNDPDDPAPQTLQPCDEKILASQSSPSEITLVTVGDKKDPKFWDDLARDLRALPSSATKAILCQQWSRAFAAFEELARRGIPVELGNELDLSQHHLSALWIAFLKAQDPAASREAHEYWNHLAREWDLVPLADADAPPAQDPRAWLRLFVSAAAPHRWPEGSAWLASLETWLQAHCAQLRWIPGALELAAAFEKSMNMRLNLDSPSEYFAGGERAGKVVITTIHKSKGLQYDSVFLIELFDGNRRAAAHSVSDADEEESLESIPLRSASGKLLKPLYFKYKKVQDDQRVLAEKKRLFYVAYTRAERNLFFCLDERGDGSKRSESLESAVWGWPRAEGLGWQGVVSAPAARVADHVPVRERRIEAAADEATTVKGETWTLPAPRSEWGDLPPELKRLGTSTYIGDVMFPEDQPVLPLSDLSVPKPRDAQPVDPENAKALGSALHKILERWDGRAATIGEALAGALPVQRTKLRTALEQLAHFDELQPLWADAQSHPERVQREMGLFVHREGYRLSGFADLVWFRAPNHAVVLDWKTSTTEYAATHELKLAKTEAQVALYASSLAPVIPKVEIWSLAIIFEPEVRLKWLFRKDASL